MGQRTFILLKKNFGNNRSTINLIHHQWGIGKVMPSLLLQEILRYEYPLDRSKDYGGTHPEAVEQEFTFAPLSNPQNNYIYNEEVKTDEVDVFDIDTINKYAHKTDNNNGGMIVEVTQKFDSNGKAKTYGDMLDVKISFVLGDEECDFYHRNFKESIKIEKPFTRLVSSKEFITKTFGKGNKERNKWNLKFHKAFKIMLDLCGVEEIYDKGKAVKIAKREKMLQAHAEVLTKNLKDGERIEVPEYLKLQVNPFK